MIVYTKVSKKKLVNKDKKKQQLPLPPSDDKKKDADLEKNYLLGKYGAIPDLKPFNLK